MTNWLKFGSGPLASKPRGSNITDVQDLKALNDHSDTDKPIRLGFWVLIVGFGAFVVWASFAPLDEGVSTQGQVSMESKRKTLQHLSGGVVKSVMAKEGVFVHKGDLLIELDNALAKANYESVRQNYMGQRALESRLLAEQRGLDQVQFHPDLIKSSADPLVLQHMQSQIQVFNSKKGSLNAEMQAIDENLRGLKAQFDASSLMLQSRNAQANYQEQQIKSISELANEGYAPRNQLLQLQQSRAELRSMLADLQGTLNRIQSTILEVQQRKSQKNQEYLKDVSQQLADVRREVQSGQDKLRSVSEDLSRTQIVAPVDGQVVGLTLSTLGSVVSPGQRLMDIVPQGEALLIDAKIPPHIIDKVFKGQSVDVRFSTFANAPQLVLEGELLSVSSDVINEQTAMGMQSYYLARAKITDKGYHQLGKRVLQPGMPAEVLIKTGERSFMTYLLHPLTKRIAASMKEE